MPVIMNLRRNLPSSQRSRMPTRKRIVLMDREMIPVGVDQVYRVSIGHILEVVGRIDLVGDQKRVLTDRIRMSI